RARARVEPAARRAAALQPVRVRAAGDARGAYPRRAPDGRLLRPQVSRIAYTRGLHELGDGLYAYLQPDGGWGWSNAGLIAAEGTSLIVDTLFDLRLTRDMLEAMRPITERSPIGPAMNTHGNGNHWF